MSKERDRLLMQQDGIRAKGKNEFVVTTDIKHRLPVAPALVQRFFVPAAPHPPWSGDSTGLPTDAGRLCRAAVVDLHSRQVVGQSLQPHMHSPRVNDALLMAYFGASFAARLFFLNDRRTQCCRRDYQGALKAWDIRSSMFRKGYCWNSDPTGLPIGSV